MNVREREIKIKRVSSRKRSRGSLKSSLTPAKKRGGGTCLQQCPQTWRLSSDMAHTQDAEVGCCSKC